MIPKNPERKRKILNRNSKWMAFGDQKKVQMLSKWTGKSRKCSEKLRGSPVTNGTVQKKIFFVKSLLYQDSYLRICDCML